MQIKAAEELIVRSTRNKEQGAEKSIWKRGEKIKDGAGRKIKRGATERSGIKEMGGGESPWVSKGKKERENEKVVAKEIKLLAAMAVPTV